MDWLRDFRIAVGNSLSYKLGEFGFFLKQVVNVAQIIEHKHLYQEFPINDELNQLNYYFSAYLNTIQSLRDSLKITTGMSILWEELLPKYWEFIQYCRNATTHDGSHLINGGKGSRCYIVGPLRRIDGKGKPTEINPPKEDICLLCCNISREILENLRKVLNRNDVNIPSVDENDVKKSISESLNNDFIPPEFRALMKADLHNNEKLFKGVKIDIKKKILDAIGSVEKILADVCI